MMYVTLCLISIGLTVLWWCAHRRAESLQIQLDDANRTLESNQRTIKSQGNELHLRSQWITKMQNECETRDATIQRQASDIVRLESQLAAAQHQAAQRRGR